MKNAKNTKNTERTRDIWYRLDNAANVFPSVSDGNNTNVFRLACELRESVDPELLQQALDMVIEDFPYFRVVMRRGFFWFYLERTNLHPKIRPETGRPCNRIFYRQVKELLFHISWFGNRINLEVFHAISDGAGAFDLLYALVYRYLILSHRHELPAELPSLDREPPPAQQSRDSFRHYYDPAKTDAPFRNRGYTIGGTLLPSGSIRVISATMPTGQIIALAKARGVTVTAYLASLMICAIYHEMMPRRAAGRTISVIVPVDLRSHFSAETTRNFFTVVDVGYNFARQGGDFDEVLESVSRQLVEKIHPGALSGRLNFNMAMQRNIFSRFIPLFLKNPVIRIAYRRAESSSTCALSNLGRLTMPEPFDGYIDRFSCLLNPTRQHRWKACVCSFEDRFVINFTSCIAETAMHRYFIRHLTGQGVDVCITCNGGIDDEIL